MARKPNDKAAEAKKLYQSGMKLIDIANKLDIPSGTVRRWKSTYEWDIDNSERSDKKANVRNENEHIIAKKEKVVADEVGQIIENSDLTDKQQLFCCLYIKCFNATKAYQKAYGCAYSTALTNGSALLGNARIKNEIARLKQNRLNREMLSEEDIFQKYMDIAFADITDYVEFGQKEVPVMGPFGPIKIEDPNTGEKVELTKMVNAVSFRESGEVDGTLIAEVKQGKDGASIKLPDRLKALDWLADHMDMATAEQKAKIKKLEAESERIRRETSPEDDEGVIIINDTATDIADIGNNHPEISKDIQ